MTDGTSSFAGKLLIAMPNLADPNFWRSVVLLGVHSGDEGAFGLIVNRRLDVDMREILSELGEETAAEALPGVFAGGPVQPSHGFVLFERGEIAANAEDIAVSEDIVLSGSIETLTRLARGSARSRYFLLLGYAGWHPGQLEREIEENSWVIAPLEPSLLFDVPVEERWSEALRSIGIEPGTLVDAGSTEPS
ncbi:MAG TPA: YqgE/AlgH family protein [Chondromyces sp.]|nr:YqgE/AlgH family protein [Chondromyces sp.]